MNVARILTASLAFSSLPLASILFRPPVNTAASAGFVLPATPMLSARAGHSATLLADGKVLVAGGMRGNQDFYRSAELFDPATGKFQVTGEMSLARVGHAAVLLPSGKVLVVGGWIGYEATDSAELYDPATGRFATIAKMTARRGRPSATLLINNDVLIAGGAEGVSATGIKSAEVFHAATMTFERVGSMHYGRFAQTATLLADGRVLIAGGRGESVTAATELYDPKTRQFTPTGNLCAARYKHTAGFLPDGRVLIAGGSDDRDANGRMSSAEIYDPHTGKFTPTSPLNNGRYKLPNPSVQLASGQLLVAGGSKQVEIYNPETGKFLLASGELDGPWHFMSETLLKDGRVLLAGGYPDSNEVTAHTWLYRP